MLVTRSLTADQERIQKLARELAREYIAPIARELDESEAFPREAIFALGREGLFGISIPKEYGGMGLGIFEFCLATEEIARIDGAASTAFAATLLGALPIILYGTHEQKLKYLTPIARGEKLASFALSEPGAGSDAGTLETTAMRDGDNYIISGAKRFITNAGQSDIYSVFAVTDKSRGPRGISSFIIEKGAPGMKFGEPHKKMGIRASATCNIAFDHVAVPAENLIGGKENMGFIHAIRTFEHSRPGVAAQAVGIAQGALDLALRYAKKREQFGKTISTFQGIQWMLADMEIKVEAARALTYAVIDMVVRGDREVSAAAAAAKVFASDTAMQVTTDAVQIYGGWGYMRVFEVERFMRDAKVTQIYEGTNQIQRNIIALRMIKG
ncbi:MAG: acyl-CoA dehydrogenase family protein [Spirochaetota bacterium]